jgi:hypothetical protein
VEKEGFATAWVFNGKPGKPFEAKLDNTTRLKGVFTGPDGRPLRDVVAVIITARGTSRVWPGRPATSPPLSDYLTLVRQSGDGSYDWLMEPGAYTVELRSRDGMCALVKPFEIKAGVTQSIPATFAPGRDFRIRVTDTNGMPLSGVEFYRMEYDGGAADIIKLNGMSPIQTTDADGVAHWRGLPPWKGWFSIRGTKLKRCLNDMGFRESDAADPNSPLGGHRSDHVALLRFDLSNLSETSVRVQLK